MSTITLELTSKSTVQAPEIQHWSKSTVQAPEIQHSSTASTSTEYPSPASKGNLTAELTWLTTWLDCGKRVIQKISNNGSHASYGPYHHLELPHHGIKPLIAAARISVPSRTVLWCRNGVKLKCHVIIVIKTDPQEFVLPSWWWCSLLAPTDNTKGEQRMQLRFPKCYFYVKRKAFTSIRNIHGVQRLPQ